jgi:hypothetical protein
VTPRRPPKAQEADGDGGVSLKEYGDQSHQSHILDSGAKVRGHLHSACFNASQGGVWSQFDLVSRGWEADQHAIRCDDVLSPDTQSFTAAAIKLYSEAKKTQLFSSKISARGSLRMYR